MAIIFSSPLRVSILVGSARPQPALKHSRPGGAQNPRALEITYKIMSVSKRKGTESETDGRWSEELKGPPMVRAESLSFPAGVTDSVPRTSSHV